MCMLTEACVEWISAEVIALFRAAADVAAILCDSRGYLCICCGKLRIRYGFQLRHIIKAKLSVAEAMRESVMVGWQNKGAFLVYTLAIAALGGLALIPFGLGLVVWVPLVSLSAYTCYRDMVGASPITPAEILVE